LLFHLRNHLRRHHALHVAGAQLSLVSVLCAAFAIASASAWPAYAHLETTAGRARAVHAAAAQAAAQPVAASAAEAGADPGVIRLQDLSPDEARAWNAAHPLSSAANPAAKPFNLAAEGVLDEARATDCMTAAIYYEAGFESLEGERAVAQVVINRLRNPLFPKTVCGVVFQGAERATGCQFTFTCDGALARKPQEEAWERARKVAVAALHGYVMKKVGNATHYHADYVAPYWSPTLVKVAVVGQHIFYRWTGGLGLPPAFGGRYAGGEMKGLQIATLDNLAHVSGGSTVGATDESAAVQAPQQVAAVEADAAPKAAVAAAAAGDMVTPDKVAQDAGAALKPEELDWQGRPRQKGPPRIARPGGLGY
jgi:spore germination cell wall hydrolase CwlJ-like protein